jgi:CheY-like chemotaxis protein
VAGACVALVHDDPQFAEQAAIALRGSGYDVAVYPDSMAALNAIEATQKLDVLITRVSFPEGRPNGISLALVLRNKYPVLKVVFVAQASYEEYTEGIGELVPQPVDVPRLIKATDQALSVS